MLVIVFLSLWALFSCFFSSDIRYSTSTSFSILLSDLLSVSNANLLSSASRNLWSNSDSLCFIASFSDLFCFSSFKDSFCFSFWISVKMFLDKRVSSRDSNSESYITYSLKIGVWYQSCSRIIGSGSGSASSGSLYLPSRIPFVRFLGRFKSACLKVYEISPKFFNLNYFGC